MTDKFINILKNSSKNLEEEIRKSFQETSARPDLLAIFQQDINDFFEYILVNPTYQTKYSNLLANIEQYLVDNASTHFEEDFLSAKEKSDLAVGDYFEFETNVNPNDFPKKKESSLNVSDRIEIRSSLIQAGALKWGERIGGLTIAQKIALLTIIAEYFNLKKSINVKISYTLRFGLNQNIEITLPQSPDNQPYMVTVPLEDKALKLFVDLVAHDCLENEMKNAAIHSLDFNDFVVEFKNTARTENQLGKQYYWLSHHINVFKRNPSLSSADPSVTRLKNQLELFVKNCISLRNGSYFERITHQIGLDFLLQHFPNDYAAGEKDPLKKLQIGYKNIKNLSPQQRCCLQKDLCAFAKTDLIKSGFSEVEFIIPNFSGKNSFDQMHFGGFDIIELRVTPSDKEESFSIEFKSPTKSSILFFNLEFAKQVSSGEFGEYIKDKIKERKESEIISISPCRTPISRTGTPINRADTPLDPASASNKTRAGSPH